MSRVRSGANTGLPMIPKVHDLQCGWQLLLQCAGPRCHHFLRTVPPSQSRKYAEGHDQGVWEVMVAQRSSSRRWIATGSGAPVGFAAHEDGRFRPSFGSQNFPSCFWASWADVLSMIQIVFPDAVIRQPQVVSRSCKSRPGSSI